MSCFAYDAFFLYCVFSVFQFFSSEVGILAQEILVTSELKDVSTCNRNSKVIIDFEEEHLQSNKFPAVCFLWVQIKEP